MMELAGVVLSSALAVDQTIAAVRRLLERKACWCEAPLTQIQDNFVAMAGDNDSIPRPW